MSLGVAFLVLASGVQIKQEVIPLWPNGAPGSEARKDEPETKPHPWSIAHIYNPSLTIFRPPAGKANGAAVVIAPGGGHRELVVGEEGYKPAKFLNTLGITAFVLKYRLAREDGSGLSLEKDTPADAFRAMRLVRHRAKEWGLDPKRIGVLGFSAGGEIASMISFGPGKGDPKTADPIDQEDERPNFSMFIYPGPLGIPETLPTDAPPAFVLVANNDGLSAVALSLTAKYRAAKRPIELHLLNSGGHGFNMGDRFSELSIKTWPQRMSDWLTDSGFLKW